MFGYFRDDTLNAADAVAGRVLPYSNQQVGGALGGPIVHDKIHYFVSYEFEREPSTAVSVPTFLPGQVFSFPSQNVNKSYFGRVDGDMGRHGHVNLRWTRSSFGNDFAATAGDRHPSAASMQQQRSQNVLGTWQRTLGASAASEIRVGYNAFSFGNLNIPEVDGTINYGFPGLSIGPATNQPNIFFQNTYQARGDLTWLAGAHTSRSAASSFASTTPATGRWLGAGRFVFNTRPPDLNARFPANAWNNLRHGT